MYGIMYINIGNYRSTKILHMFHVGKCWEGIIKVSDVMYYESTKKKTIKQTN